MSDPATALVCAGCGQPVAPEAALPFRCAAAAPGDDIDHVVARAAPPADAAWPEPGEPNPFVRFRTLQHSWRVARERGLSDDDYVALVRELDGAVAEVDGHGFTQTPLVEAPALADELGLFDGALWVKNETINVSGSHKARHLMGIAVYLAVAERTGLLSGDPASRTLAIASCGNAALAAAVVARAAGRPLRVFIPTWAAPRVVERLEALGAALEVCERRPGDPPGDPCYLRFRAAVEAGALPFTCQGNENGLTIDGGMTLAWELADQLGGEAIDRLVVQVGGGALATACARGLQWAHALGALARMPAVHTVQTAGVHPLILAWRRVVDGASARHRGSGATPLGTGGDRVRVGWQREHRDSPALAEELARAARHRSHYMLPVSEPAHSIATGILDDETYDWLAIVRAMVASDGWPVTVGEATLARARDRGREVTGIDVDATGSAGLAGAYALRAAGSLRAGDRIAVLFTGATR